MTLRTGNAAKRFRQIYLTEMARDGFEITVVERWTLPANRDDCLLPPAFPKASCEKTRKLALHLERSCAKPCNVIDVGF